MSKVKSFAVLLALAAIPAVADVEALYWQVTPENNSGNIEFSYAALVATKDNDPNSPHYFEDTEGGVFQAAKSDKKSTEVVASVIGSDYSTGWSFFIEMWNYDSSAETPWTKVGVSNQTYSYSDLSSYMHSTMSMGTLSTLSPTVVVPEPTSGLLLLLGGSLLALRRRRRV